MSNNVKFYLNRSFANGKRAIQLRTHINKSLFTYQTGQSIIPELWDKKTRRPTKTKGKVKPYRKEFPTIDIDLENIGTRLNNITQSLKRELLAFNTNGQQVDFKELREKLDASFKKVKNRVRVKEQNKDITLNEFLESHIKNIENGNETYKLRGEVKKYSPSTVKVYKEWKTQFLAFQKKQKRVYNFDDITIDFYDKYVNHFVKKNYTTNSIGKQVKTLKTIMRTSMDKGLHTNKEFLNKKFQTPKAEVDSIYLTNKELELFYNLDLSDRPHLERDRDIFLVGCWTALRINVLLRIRPEHIKTRDGSKYIEYITNKTTEKVIIPIRPEVDKILSRYNYRLPKTYRQKVNDNIKIIGKELEIDELISIAVTKGGMTVKSELPKYKLIKTHTARRTGATLMYKADIPLLDICKITGHRKPESLLRYIKITKEETAKILSLNSFFTGEKLKSV